ncbi:MAG: DUF4013 domain-containing protein [Verrucomicrobia bacterium]|nr:DUF4013 domain-containing protein [Verrucomicrobiota bacterium]
MENDERFGDLKAAFRAVTRDGTWWWKVLLGGPMLFIPVAFLIPMGFTMEVLRRAKNNPGKFVLPGFGVSLWGRYAKEGLIKLVIAFGTLLAPVLAWMGFTWAVALILRFPGSDRWQFFFEMLLPFASPVAFFVTIPFCAVACCRYLESGRIGPAFDYVTNVKIYRAGFVDFSIGAVVIMGMNAIAQTWMLPLMWGLFFGLCVVDCWFGPIYNEAARRVKREEEAAAASSAEDEESLSPD